MTITNNRIVTTKSGLVTLADEGDASAKCQKATVKHSVQQTSLTRVPEDVANETKSVAKDELFEGRVDSFDHVTFWVGNAKQSAVFYMTQFGFQPFAFRGLETGSRDVACHVVRLNDTIIEFVSAVEPNNKQLNNFLLSHGDAVKDIAFRVENIEALLKHALEAGAELVAPLEVFVSGDSDDGCDDKKEDKKADSRLAKYITKRATIKTFGDVTHTFVERNYDYQPGRFLPGYHKPSLEVSHSSPLSLATTTIILFTRLDDCAVD